MAITGNKKEASASSSTGYKKTYGLMAYEIVGVNLSNKELKELDFYVKEGEEDNEREFTSERDGVKVCQIEFACRPIAGNSRARRFTFWLEDKNARNSEEKERALYKFINDQGRTAWSLTPDDYTPLNESYAVYFTGEDDSLNPRPAKRGEEELMLFMRACMAIDFKNGGTIKYNLKKFFNGNFKDLKDDLKTEFLTSVIVATTIKLKQGDEGMREIESFYPYAFAPGSNYKILANKKAWTTAEVDKIRTAAANNKGKKGKERVYITPLEEILIKISDADYGCKDLYHMGLPVEYTSDNHIEASEAAIIEEDSSIDSNSPDY